MAAEWRTFSVSDLIADSKIEIGDGYRAKNSELAAHGFPFARVANIDGGFNFDGVECLPAEAAGRVRGKLSRPGDTAFTSKGTVGRLAFVRDETPTFVYSPQLCFWRSLDHSVLDPRFLYAWMHSREFYVQFRGVAGQTDMADYVNLGDQRHMRITLPPLAEQRAIAGILGAFDDKIEVNRKLGATLEAMARALFQSWFVDFDPVRAKAAGRPTGLPAEVAALFPDRFQASELGPIPEGWRVKPIGELATVCGGSTPRTSSPEFWDGGVNCWATPRDLAGNQLPLLTRTSRAITARGLAEIPSGLLPRGTVLLSSRAPIGYTAVATIPVAINQGFIAIGAMSGVSNIYLLFWARSAMDRISARANGSTFLEINKASFRSIPALAPTPAVMEIYHRKAKPLFMRMGLAEEEASSLAALRDALLPKLISGEMRVAEARKFAATV